MSQATVARKERRKRFIARLKQNCERNPACESRFDNTHACQQHSFQDIIAATQQACIASFVQGCDYAKTMYYSAFQDGFLAGNEQARTSQAQTVDISIQTDWVDLLGLEPNQSKVHESRVIDESGTNRECTLQTRRSSSMDVLGPQQATSEFFELEPKHASSNEACGVTKSVIAGGLEPRISRHNAAPMHSTSLLPQHVLVDPVRLEPKRKYHTSLLQLQLEVQTKVQQEDFDIISPYPSG